MSVLNDIVLWAQNELPDWQSDAARRILTQDIISDEDKSAILLMVKKQFQLIPSNANAPFPQKMQTGLVSGASGIHSKVNLQTIKEMKNVNALPDGTKINFGEQGLTLIYGKNGAGKSGYARILKRACKARDYDHIYTNVYSKTSGGPATATFVVNTGAGGETEIKWVDGQPGNNILLNICVFDAKCARVILNEKNEISYLPYGAYLFPSLVALLQELQQKLRAEKVVPVKPAYDDIPLTSTSGQFMAQLTCDTNTEMIELATQWDNKQDIILQRLLSAVAKVEADNPASQISMLRTRHKRFISFLNAAKAIDANVSDPKVSTLRQMKTSLNGLTIALEIASADSLKNEPLPGVGGNEWQFLYNAAKEYSTKVAYHGVDFPYFEAGSRCVLCMQFLDSEAQARLSRFKQFMESTISSQIEVVKNTLKSTVAELNAIIIDSGLWKDLIEEIRFTDDKVANQIENYFRLMAIRKLQIINMVTSASAVAIDPTCEFPTELIASHAQSLENQAQALEKNAKPEQLCNLKTQISDLTAKKNLFQRKQAVVDYIQQLQHAKRYDDCIENLSGGHITRKGKEIISNALGGRLKGALETELKAVGADRIPINWKLSGSTGETLHKLELGSAQKLINTNLSDILSEGEQRVIAIAGFLAELNVAGHQSTIVFDDPVCSLDHIWREKVARRLVEYAKSKQVVVFTHDIVFANDLMTYCEKENVNRTDQFVSARGSQPGFVDSELPWKAGRYKERIDRLEKACCRVKELHNIGKDEDYELCVRKIYSMLRASWERVLEDVAFCDTVLRHRDYIKVTNLCKVSALELADCADFLSAHNKCSGIIEGHDPSRGRDAPVPKPSEIEQDIKFLKDWIDKIKSKQNSIR